MEPNYTSVRSKTESVHAFIVPKMDSFRQRVRSTFSHPIPVIFVAVPWLLGVVYYLYQRRIDRDSKPGGSFIFGFLVSLSTFLAAHFVVTGPSLRNIWWGPSLAVSAFNAYSITRFGVFWYITGMIVFTAGLNLLSLLLQRITIWTGFVDTAAFDELESQAAGAAEKALVKGEEGMSESVSQDDSKEVS